MMDPAQAEGWDLVGQNSFSLGVHVLRPERYECRHSKPVVYILRVYLVVTVTPVFTRCLRSGLIQISNMKYSTLSVLLAPVIVTAVPCGRSSTSGCGAQPPFAQGTFSTSTIDTADGSRQYGVWVPSTYDQTTKSKLIFSYHGASSDITKQRALDGLTQSTFNKDHIVVYLQGVSYHTLTGQ